LSARFTFECRPTSEAGLRWNPFQAGDEATVCSRIFWRPISAVVQFRALRVVSSV